VAVGGPGIGGIRVRKKMRVMGARRGPQPEGAVNVHPRAEAPGNRNQGLEAIIGADVDVARLKQHDGWRLKIGLEGSLQGIRKQAVEFVNGQVLNLFLPQAE
jgi:hypothetical protein